jgi:glutamine synthetase
MFSHPFLDLPSWNFDGSSTGQASGQNSDVRLKPVAMYPDPFLAGNSRLVLCATYDHEGKPTATNYRDECQQHMEAIREKKPWFGIEQEYLMLDLDGYPLGLVLLFCQHPLFNALFVAIIFSWPKNGFPAHQGPYYCGVGANRVFGRELVEAHYRACLYAGIEIAGTNAGVFFIFVFSFCTLHLIMLIFRSRAGSMGIPGGHVRRNRYRRSAMDG